MNRLVCTQDAADWRSGLRQIPWNVRCSFHDFVEENLDSPGFETSRGSVWKLMGENVFRPSIARPCIMARVGMVEVDMVVVALDVFVVNEGAGKVGDFGMLI